MLPKARLVALPCTVLRRGCVCAGIARCFSHRHLRARACSAARALCPCSARPFAPPNSMAVNEPRQTTTTSRAALPAVWSTVATSAGDSQVSSGRRVDARQKQPARTGGLRRRQSRQTPGRALASHQAAGPPCAARPARRPSTRVAGPPWRRSRRSLLAGSIQAAWLAAPNVLTAGAGLATERTGRRRNRRNRLHSSRVTRFIPIPPATCPGHALTFRLCLSRDSWRPVSGWSMYRACMRWAAAAQTDTRVCPRPRPTDEVKLTADGEVETGTHNACPPRLGRRLRARETIHIVSSPAGPACQAVRRRVRQGPFL